MVKVPFLADSKIALSRVSMTYLYVSKAWQIVHT